MNGNLYDLRDNGKPYNSALTAKVENKTRTKTTMEIKVKRNHVILGFIDKKFCFFL